MKSNSKNFLNGEYIFYKNGVEVARSKNIITNNGKEAVVAYLSKDTKDYASRIVLGCGSTTPTAIDEFMSFEVFPTSVEYKTLDYTQTPTQIVFRSTLPSTFKGVIYESGLSTTGGVLLSALNDVNDNSEIVATFDPDYESWSLSSGVSIHANELGGTPRLRVGDSGLQFVVPPNSSRLSTYSNISPLDYYIESDKIKVAFHVSGAIPSSIVLKLSEDSTNFYNAVINQADISAGYNIKTIPVSSLVKTGTPEFQTISEISVAVTSPNLQTVVTMDAIRFDKYSDVNKPTLVSRSVLSTPLVVEGGTPFDVEYRLGFSI